MKRTNKDKLALFILLRTLYEKKGLGTMQANMEAYKRLEQMLKSLNYENLKRLYEQTELCIIKDRERCEKG